MNITKKLRNFRSQSYQSSVSNVIFGEVTSFNRYGVSLPTARMAILPCISADTEESLGLWILFSNLLNYHPDIQTYNIWVLPEKLNDEYEWTIADSQFPHEAWQDKDLYENAVIWGQYNASEYQLDVSLSGILQNNRVSVFTIKGDSVGSILAQLPTLANQIATELKLETVIFPDFSLQNTVSDNTLWQKLLDWEVALFMNIADDFWDETELLNDYKQLITLATKHSEQLIEWGIFASLKGLFSRFYQPTDTMTRQIVEEVENSNSYFGVLSLSDSLYKVGRVTESIQILRKFIEKHPQNTNIVIQLSQFLVLNFQLEDAIRNYRKSILEGFVSDILYKNYADTLVLAQYYQLPLTEFVLAPKDSIDWEIISAYHKSLELKKNAEIHTKLLEKLYELDEEAFLAELKILIVTNISNPVWDIIDLVQDADTLELVIDLLASLTKEYPESVLVKLYYIQVLIYDEQYQEAQNLLDEISDGVDSTDYKIDFERLGLQIDFPDYEYQMMQISEILGAGNKPSSESVDFLEEVLEISPQYAEAYLLLANCYESWGDTEAALEVLLDAHNQLPSNLRVIYQISQNLWSDNQYNLALDYLMKGLKVDPVDMSLLTRMARYLFESGKIEEAKSYLTRAEAINPRHESLSATRIFIGTELAND